MGTETSGQAFEKGKDAAGNLIDKADEKENQVLKAVDKAQGVVREVTPAPTDFDAVSSPSELKARLDWGEPALSIVDIRDRNAFNEERIMGAIAMPMSDLTERAGDSFEAERDIYVYGESDEETAAAVTQLNSAGFQRVSAIQGGLAAWKAVGGSIEGRASL